MNSCVFINSDFVPCAADVDYKSEQEKCKSVQCSDTELLKRV
jgi:hypothetical protein